MAKRPKKFDATLKYLLELFPSAGPALLGLHKKGRGTSATPICPP
jgi:hypothetical protein